MNFNRYTYAMNNPLRYNDPSGDIILEFLVGFVDGFFSSGRNRWQNAWNGGSAKVHNTGLLLQGLVEGNIGQIASRFLKEPFQTGIGFGFAWGANLLKRDVTVEHFDGATSVSSPNFRTIGVSLGSYITGRDVAVWGNQGDLNPTFMHEYGHYLQSQRSGPLYLFKYGLPSSQTGRGAPFGQPMPAGTFYTGDHDDFWVEMDANNRAFEHFRERHGITIWDVGNFPIGDTRNVRWWEPFAFMMDPVSIFRYNRPQNPNEPWLEFVLGLFR